MGETPEQIAAGEKFSDELSKKKSYTAVLNYMVENEYELVETLTLSMISTANGTGGGGTYGIIFIMKKKE